MGGRSTRRMAGAKDAEWRPFNARPIGRRPRRCRPAPPIFGGRIAGGYCRRTGGWRACLRDVWPPVFIWLNGAPLVGDSNPRGSQPGGLCDRCIFHSANPALVAPTAAVKPVFLACSAPTGKKRGEFASREPGGRAGMGVWHPGAFMDLDEEPCGLWSRLARYGACNCRSGVPPPDSAAGMVPPYWAARCAAGEFAGGHESPGDRPARRRGGGVAASLGGCRKDTWGRPSGPGQSAGTRRRQPAAPRHGGRFLRTPMGVLEAAYWRHGCSGGRCGACCGVCNILAW